MSMKLHCEHCGAAVTAPRELAGKMSKCPSCQNDVYVPTPEDEIEELPLAPEDSYELENERRMQEERRRLDSLLARENKAPDDADANRARPAASVAGPRSAPAAARMSASPEPSADPSAASRTEQALRKYLAAMRDSDFDGAERALLTLRLQPRTAEDLINRYAADQIPPPEMVNVPPGVYQGFLKSLRTNL